MRDVVHQLRVGSESAAATGRSSVAEMRNRVERLQGELTAMPYTSDPEASTNQRRRRAAVDRLSRYEVPVAKARYRGFEDTFRGAEEFIRERQRPYLDLLAGRSPVLDLGCGRGEFLELARRGRNRGAGNRCRFRDGRPLPREGAGRRAGGSGLLSRGSARRFTRGGLLRSSDRALTLRGARSATSSWQSGSLRPEGCSSPRR